MSYDDSRDYRYNLFVFTHDLFLDEYIKSSPDYMTFMYSPLEKLFVIEAILGEIAEALINAE